MAGKDLSTSKSLTTIKDGLWRDHPTFSMILGICSALAVTNRVENAIAMGLGVTFVLIATGVFISLLRNLIPQRVRMMTYMLVIAAFVIIVDKFLRAFYPDISEAIGPYVGLIITNCILMGRAEAFYIQNTLGLSVLDAIANGIGYTYALLTVSIVREILGFGTLLGHIVIPEGWTRWGLMTMAPGAFFVLSIFIWVTRTLAKKEA